MQITSDSFFNFFCPNFISDLWFIRTVPQMPLYSATEIHISRTSMSISNSPDLDAFTKSVLPFGSTKLATSSTHDRLPFEDRRKGGSDDHNRTERRQFGDGHRGLSGAGRELALAIDRYKLRHHRRYLTCDELLRVMMQLGYVKT